MTLEQKQEYLEMETIHQGHFDDQVIDDTKTRVWVSRCESGQDGQPLVTIEQLFSNGWEIVDKL